MVQCNTEEVRGYQSKTLGHLYGTVTNLEDVFIPSHTTNDVLITK